MDKPCKTCKVAAICYAGGPQQVMAVVTDGLWQVYHESWDDYLGRLHAEYDRLIPTNCPRREELPE